MYNDVISDKNNLIYQTQLLVNIQMPHKRDVPADYICVKMKDLQNKEVRR